MVGKSRQAVVIGLALWVAGAGAVILLGPLPFFAGTAPTATLLLAPPAMYFVARFHLRDVSPSMCVATGLRLSVVVTAIQLPLDAMGLVSIQQFGFPSLDSTARLSAMLALQVGYFWMLLVPWWVGWKQSVT